MIRVLQCAHCGYRNSFDAYALTGDTIKQLRNLNVPENILHALDKASATEFDTTDALIREHPILSEASAEPYVSLILKESRHSRRFCQHCGIDVHLRDSRLQLPAQFKKLVDLLEASSKGHPRLVEYLGLHPVPAGWRVGYMQPHQETELANLDRMAFMPGNRFGDDMITLANDLPHSVFILSNERSAVRGFLDMFFFKPDTFCKPDSLSAKVTVGRLPSAQDILSSRELIRDKHLLKGQVVDVYIDALCAYPDEGQQNYLAALLKLTAHTLCTDDVFKTVRLNRVATVSVANGGTELHLQKGGQNLTMDAGDYWAYMAGMEQLTTGYDSTTRMARTLYCAHYKQSLPRLSYEGIILLTRAFKPLLNHFAAVDSLVNLLDSCLHDGHQGA